MRRFWQHDAEYCQLQGEMVIKTPLQFGPVILKPGDRITYEDNPTHKVKTLWLVRGPLGGGRDIILEEVRMATHEPIKRKIYEQGSLFKSF